MIPGTQRATKTDVKKIILFGIIFIICSFAFYWVKYQSAPLVESLYTNRDISFLNKITGATTEERLGFYLGQAQEAFFGPLSQLISGLIFTAFALLFLRKASFLKFGLAAFIYLIVTKFEVLFFPPYGDAIGGPFAEAIWLVRHSFDYEGLFHAPGYASGGPRVYLFSIYPTYLALLMKLIPGPKAFLVVNHLIVFAFAATIVAVLRDIFMKVFSRDLSILAALILLFLPLFQSQTEAINMEMPCVFFIMLSVHALMKKRIHRAGILALFAVLVKGTGVFVCAGFFLVSLVLFFGRGEFRFNKKVLLWGIGLVLFSIAKTSLKFLTNDQHVSAGMVHFGKGWPSLERMYIFYFYAASLIFLLVHYAKNKWQSRQARQATTATPFGQHPAWMMFIFAGMWFALFLNFYAVSPRYRISAYPFLIFCVFYVFSLFVQSQRLRKGGLIIVVAIALFSSYGFFYPPMLENDHVQLERSLEYRNDLEVNQRVVKALEERYEGFRIGAPFTMAQLLALPELRYVKKKLDVMIYGFQCRYGGIKEFPGVRKLKLGRTIYVGVKSVQQNKDFPYPVHPEDRVIEEIQYGNKKAWLFMGGISIDMVLRASRLIQLQRMYEGRK